MKNEVINLKKITTTKDRDGYITEKIESEKQVFADVKSVSRNEFYSAMQAGVKATAIFVVNAFDYSDESEIEYNSKRYTVVRSYQTNLNDVELTCEDKDVT